MTASCAAAGATSPTSSSRDARGGVPAQPSGARPPAQRACAHPNSSDASSRWTTLERRRRRSAHPPPCPASAAPTSGRWRALACASGEPIAMVLAASRAEAEDMIESLVPDIEELPPGYRHASPPRRPAGARRLAGQRGAALAGGRRPLRTWTRPSSCGGGCAPRASTWRRWKGAPWWRAGMRGSASSRCTPRRRWCT
jgi:hypothetical protein